MPTCALVGAAEFNAEHFQEMDADGLFKYVIAVDAGLKHLQAIGRRPDMALGDFDSLGYIPKGLHVSRHSPIKDKSDMELALDRVKTLRYDQVFIYGGLSGRLDHTLANLQLFARFSELGMYVTGIAKDMMVTFVTGPDIYEMPARDKGVVSVFSMNDTCAGVFERGLFYELDDATLTNRTSLGLSNELKGEPVMIGVEQGTIAVFVEL